MVPGGHTRTYKKWIPRTGPGTGPGTLVLVLRAACGRAKPVLGLVPGPVLGLVPGLVLGLVLGQSQDQSWDPVSSRDRSCSGSPPGATAGVGSTHFLRYFGLPGQVDAP